MGTGQKIALGCGCLVLGAGMVATGMVVYGTYWAKGKIKQAGGVLDQYTAKADEIAKWETKANAHPFTPPADGLISEPQLRKFLDVRKDIYTVYEQHKPEFDDLGRRTKDQKDLTFSQTIEAGGKLASLVGDIRLTQAKALAGFGMSESEYRYIQMAVYKTAWASEVKKGFEGKNPSEAIAESTKQMQGQVEQAMEAARKGGVQGADQFSQADVQKTDEAVQQMGQAMAAGMKQLEVPQANIELFRKYQDEINKYAMHGLAMVGL
ncbi:MAG TPA: hypothetical protein VEQ10_04735 [Vicinamibacteria bacterium]|nr:hypothetical protein [Vicinamibacteria bacterium]